MTEKELIDNCWEPKICKIAKMYFKDKFFCRFDFKDNNKVLVFSTNDDMNPIGSATTYDEIIELQKESDLQDIQMMEAYLDIMKKNFNIKYDSTRIN